MAKLVGLGGMHAAGLLGFPEVAVGLFVVKFVGLLEVSIPGLARDYPLVAIALLDSSMRSLLLACTGTPRVANDLLVAKIVSGWGGAAL